MTRVEELLEKTSRTFALSIPVLPEPTRRQVMIAYLLFRIADTFEDAAHWPPAHASSPLQRLLSAQLVILAAMAFASWRVQSGRLVLGGRAGNALAWAGGIYMAGSLARIAVGLAVPAAPDWFRTWIPAVFHVVLAAYVLTLALCHRRVLGLAHGEAHK